MPEPGETQGRLRGRSAAWLAAGCAAAYVALSLWTSRRFDAVPPDTAHYLSLARNLWEGVGYQVDFRYLHPGLQDSVSHVPELHGVLHPFLLAGVFGLVGVGPVAARVLGLVCVAALGLICFRLARQLFGLTAGWLALGLVLTSPSLTLWAVSGLDDVPFALAVVATLALLARGLERERSLDFAWAGAAAGVAVLLKPIGFVLPVAFLALLPAAWRAGPVAVLSRSTAAALPFLVGASAYFVRNTLAYGSPRFRYGAFEWIYKVSGHEGGLLVYPGYPSQAEVLAGIGPAGVARLALEQLGLVLESWLRLWPILLDGSRIVDTVHGILHPAPFVLLGVFALVGCARRAPRLVAPAGLFLAATLVLVCVPFHFELRYFAFLVPLLAVVLGGLVGLGREAPNQGRTRRVFGVGAAAVPVALLIVSSFQFAAVQHTMATQRLESRPCSEALFWLERGTQPGDRVLAFVPWHVTWFSRRPAIMIPSGGSDAIEMVARHYDAHWMLVHRMGNRPQTSRVVQRFDRTARSMRAKQAWEGPQCRVLRLDWADSP